MSISLLRFCVHAFCNTWGLNQGCGFPVFFFSICMSADCVHIAVKAIKYFIH